MGRNCIICGQLFGCIRDRVKYVCTDCRLVKSCGIRNHFTTTRVTREICEPCLEGEEYPVGSSSMHWGVLVKGCSEIGEFSF